MKHFCSLLFVSIFFTLFIGCKSHQTADFTSYISGYTGGTITSSSSVLIYLNQPIKQSFQSNSELPNEILTFSPTIKGRTILKENRCLEFIPEEPFKNGETYQATFQLGALCQVPKEVEKFQFQFQILPLTVVFEAGELNLEVHSQDLFRYQGTLHSSDRLPNDQIEKMLKASYQGKTITPEWIHNGNHHYFQIRELSRGSQSEELILTFSPEISNIKKENILIPNKEEFGILNVQTSDSDPIYIQIQMSELLNPNQDLRGLIKLQDLSCDNFSIDQNSIRIYLPHSIEKNEITLHLYPGIQSISGKTFQTKYTTSLPIQSTKPEVKFLGKGVIVPDQNRTLIPFSAIGLKAVDVEIMQVFQQNMNIFLQTNSYDGKRDLIRTARPILLKKIELAEKYPNLNLNKWNDFSIDLSQLVKLEKGTIYRIRLKFKKSYTTLDSAHEEPDSEYGATDWDAKQEYAYYSEYEYPATYSWKERNNPSHLSYYTGERFVARNLINTSIGITAKEGMDNQYLVSVNDLITTEPIANCQLSFYNYQNQKMDSISTDANGIAMLRTPQKTFIVIAQKGKDRAWLKLSDGNALSLSNFDVSGQQVQMGVKGFIYGERGVWRPGDKIHLSLILEDQLQILPNGHPIVAQLIDPNGRITQTIKNSINPNHIHCFTFQTEEKAQTGYWCVHFQIGGITFKKNIRIETIKPNRLSIQAQFPHEHTIGKGMPGSSVQINTRWLNGSYTSNQKAHTEVRLYHNNAGFSKFSDYTFSDQSRHFEPMTEILFDGYTDTQGSFSFFLDNIKTEQAPGILNALFTTKVYENSGDFSISTESKRYSPYSEYVGIRLPKKEGEWYPTQQAILLHGVTVSPEGIQKGNSIIQIDVYRLNWHWWWDSENDHLSSYINRQHSKSILSEKIQAKDGKFSIPLSIKEHGRYFIQATAPSGHSTGVIAYFGNWAEINSQETATMLQLTTDKKSYISGENIRVTFPSAAGNSALITIENGKNVQNVQRITTQDGTTTFEIKAEKAMCPNIYIAVSLLQPHTNRNNDHPIRMYGVINIPVEDPDLQLSPIIQMPQKLSPGQEFSIEVKEQKGQPMHYTIAIVDEGLLSLTAFKTPDPFQAFYAREALGVKTWDYYDYIYGAYGIRLDQAFAIGGDEALVNLQDEKNNRFKPVVLFDGPFTLEAGKSKKHTFQMPEYIGEVRTTIVAAHNGHYGASSSNSTVYKPLMLSIALPRLLTPGDIVDIPVTVFALEKQLGEVEIKLIPDEKLTLLDSPSQKLQFNQKGEQLVWFKVRINQHTGTTILRAEASSTQEKSSITEEIELRLPNPRISTIKEKTVKAGESITFSSTLNGIKPQSVLEISSIPPLHLEQRMSDLLEYPHGCAEQITSKAFLQLALPHLLQLTPEQLMQSEKQIKETISQLGNFQTKEGGFSYWMGQSYVSEWVSVYLTHFLVSAKQRGYSVPIHLLQNAIDYLQKRSNQWEHQNPLDQQTQAYRLFVLALATQPNMAAMNRLKEEILYRPVTQWLLASSYALNHQEEIAQKMIKELSTKVDFYRETGGTYGSTTRDYALILQSMVILDKQQDAYRMLEQISQAMSSTEWHSTQEIAFALHAAAMFVNKYLGSQQGINIIVKTSQGIEQIQTNRTIWQLPLFLKNQKSIATVTNKGESALFVKQINSSISLDPITQKQMNGLEMEIHYYDEKGNELNFKQLPQGTEVISKIKIKHNGLAETYQELALSYLLPSGCEIINERYPKTSSLANYDHIDIRDDRFLIYFSLKQGETKIFQFRFHAAFRGEYIQPAIQCVAMYDNSIQAILPGEKIQIK